VVYYRTADEWTMMSNVESTGRRTVRLSSRKVSAGWPQQIQNLTAEMGRTFGGAAASGPDEMGSRVRTLLRPKV
jgi:hypothetical protein